MSGETSPAEGEAPVFRGKTLTPESPRPMHIPSPANIPVLENQIDPIFNLMSTHSEQPQGAGGETAAATHATKEMEQLVGLETSVTDPDTPVESGVAPSQQPTQNGGAAQAQYPEHTYVQSTFASTMPASSQTQTLSTASEDAAKLISEIAATSATADIASTSAVPDVQTLHNLAVNSNGVSAGQDPGMTPSGANPAQSLNGASVQTIPSSEQGHDATEGSSLPAPVVPESNQASSELAAAQRTAAGLPPRPPALETPSVHPDINSLHILTGTLPAAGIAAPNGATLTEQQRAVLLAMDNANKADAQTTVQTPSAVLSPSTATPSQNTAADAEAAWRTFLEEESVFTAEGAWEKFPKDSRMFVGNLPTESVSRRQMFDIFHKHGKLAQISIKQAYGFVQFMDVASCQRAMEAEQGHRIGDRSIHLETSKPPKNGRGNGNQGTSAGDRLRDRHRERTRSPNNNNNNNRRHRGSRGGNNSADLRYSDFRDEPRRGRDDYRPGRSPSPRRNDGYRPRDRSAERRYDGGRRRSRSPYGRSYGRRSPSPRRSSLGEDDLPLPRRAPGNIPDVQIILVEDVSRAFVDFVLNGFQVKGIRCDVLTMPRVPLEAVIRRQVVEGVVAVCTLTRQEERSGKVPLQVFDRSRGSHDVRFDQYDNQPVPVAAELVVRAKSQNAVMPTSPYGSGPQAPYVAPYQQAPQQVPNAAGLQNLLGNLDQSSLQQILSIMHQQQPQGQFPQQSPTTPSFPGQDISALLAAGMPQQQGPPQMQQFGTSAPPYASQMPSQQAQPPQQGMPYGYPGAGYPGMQAAGNVPPGAAPQYAQQVNSSTNNVQSIMDQLANIQRQG